MTPEEKARLEIDRQLTRCGWDVQDFKQINITAATGVAVRAFPLKTGSADYLLYVESKAARVIEAKPEGHTLKGVETQSAKYTDGLPDVLPHFHLPLPMATGTDVKPLRFPQFYRGGQLCVQESGNGIETLD
jgi:type I restriction enzyme R subunit